MVRQTTQARLYVYVYGARPVYMCLEGLALAERYFHDSDDVTKEARIVRARRGYNSKNTTNNDIPKNSPGPRLFI
jgi:hypothetical protein